MLSHVLHLLPPLPCRQTIPLQSTALSSLSAHPGHGYECVDSDSELAEGGEGSGGEGRVDGEEVGDEGLVELESAFASSSEMQVQVVGNGH